MGTVKVLSGAFIFCLSLMKQPTPNFPQFFKSPLGTVLVFLVLFYVITFAVYYFYSPGPEERRQAELANQQAGNNFSDVWSNESGSKNKE